MSTGIRSEGYMHLVDALALETIARYLGGLEEAGALRAATHAHINAQKLSNAYRKVLEKLLNDAPRLQRVPEGLVPRDHVVRLIQEVLRSSHGA